jgi:CheY-like chemotaxis protein
MPRVLLVDDDTLVLTSIQMLLIHAGFEVVAVDTGSKAILALERGSFDTIVVDIFMPGMDGIESMREFRRIVPGIPIVAISGMVFRSFSGNRSPDFLGMAAELGATTTLHKPFRAAELISAIHACVHDRAPRSEPHRKTG